MAEPWSDGDVLTAADLAGLGWGVMAYVLGSTSDQTGITSATDITSLTATWTAISTRLYLVIVQCDVQQVTSAGTAQLDITDGAGSIAKRRDNTLAAGEVHEITAVYQVTGLAGAVTRKARMSTTAGTVTVLGSTGRSPTLTVIDIGQG